MARSLFNFIFKLLGWKFIGTFPYETKKAVCIVAPHTSNWDFLVGIIARGAMGVSAKYLIKKEHFDSPLGFFFKWSGGIPVDRKDHHHLTEQIINSSTKSGNFYIAITPEGTRKNVLKWKSGFYNIALSANIPIVPFSLDYNKKTVLIGKPFHPTGDYQKDRAYFREFFKDAVAKNPENWCADFE